MDAPQKPVYPKRYETVEKVLTKVLCSTCESVDGRRAHPACPRL